MKTVLILALATVCHGALIKKNADGEVTDIPRAVTSSVALPSSPTDAFNTVDNAIILKNSTDVGNPEEVEPIFPDNPLLSDDTEIVAEPIEGTDTILGKRGNTIDAASNEEIDAYLSKALADNQELKNLLKDLDTENYDDEADTGKFT